MCIYIPDLYKGVRSYSVTEYLRKTAFIFRMISLMGKSELKKKSYFLVKNFASDDSGQIYDPVRGGRRTSASFGARRCPGRSGAEREEGREDGERSCRRLSWSEQGRNMERTILTLIYIASMSPQSRPSPTPTFPPLRWQRVWERSILLSQGFISLLLQLFFLFFYISSLSLSLSPPHPPLSLPHSSSFWATHGPVDAN